jgi:hypothetical protein
MWSGRKDKWSLTSRYGSEGWMDFGLCDELDKGTGWEVTSQ